MHISIKSSIMSRTMTFNGWQKHTQAVMSLMFFLTFTLRMVYAIQGKEILPGDSYNITCTTQANKKLESYTARDFIIKASSTTIPKENYTMIDNFTVILPITNATLSKTTYSCWVNESKINEMYLHVGTKPNKAKDFYCLKKNKLKLDMECYIEVEYNNALVNYSLIYHKDNGHDQIFKQTDFGNSTEKKFESDSISPYFNTYNFTLFQKNDLGILTQNFTVRTDFILDKFNVTVVSKTPNSVSLKWTIEDFNIIQKYGIKYEMRVHSDKFNHTSNNTFQCNNATCYQNITGLPWAYANYTAELRAKLINDTGKRPEKELWSERSKVPFQTEPQAPTRPPLTAVGGYSYFNNEIILYWQPLKECERNGPNFHYEIEYFDSNGKRVNYSTNNNDPNALSINIPGFSNVTTTTFFVRAVNNVGPSLESSPIIIYPKKTYKTFARIAAVFNDSAYIVSWAPLLDKVQNYTVFWCEQLNEDKCKDELHFESVEKEYRNYTIKRKNDATMRIAVSANLHNMSTGLNWIKCSARSTTELQDVQFTAKADSNFITIKWSNELCKSIFDGYNISYGQQNGSYTYLEPDYNNVEYKIENLLSNTLYCIEVFMFKKDESSGPVNSICKMTLPGAPSQPPTLNYSKESITNHSVKLNWELPEPVNGRLTKYLVYVNNEPRQNVSIDEIGNQNNTYVLKNLRSYTCYAVSVSAFTENESPRNNTIFFRTALGKANKPQNVDINKEESDYKTLNWGHPGDPPIPVHFYVIQVIEINESKESIITHYGHINGQKTVATFKKPSCSNEKSSQRIELISVNIANRPPPFLQNDCNYGGTTREPQEKENNEITLKLVNVKELNLNDVWKSFCEKASTDDPINICSSQYKDNPDFQFSDPYSLNYIYIDNSSSIYLIIIALIAVILFCVYMIYWLLHKYNKMSNIDAILPESLMHGTTDSGIGSEIITGFGHLGPYESYQHAIVADSKLKKMALSCDLARNLDQQFPSIVQLQKENHYLLVPGDTIPTIMPSIASTVKTVPINKDTIILPQISNSNYQKNNGKDENDDEEKYDGYDDKEQDQIKDGDNRMPMSSTDSSSSSSSSQPSSSASHSGNDSMSTVNEDDACSDDSAEYTPMSSPMKSITLSNINPPSSFPNNYCQSGRYVSPILFALNGVLQKPQSSTTMMDNRFVPLEALVNRHVESKSSSTVHDQQLTSSLSSSSLKQQQPSDIVESGYTDVSVLLKQPCPLIKHSESLLYSADGQHNSSNIDNSNNSNIHSHVISDNNNDKRSICGYVSHKQLAEMAPIAY